ncbi:four-carbon acid sugar kinase family protein [Planctomycetota bacterium]
MKTDDLLAAHFPDLPLVRREPKARAHIREHNEKADTRLVVLDDDPTGCQTVHDIEVLTAWPAGRIRQMLSSEHCFYILTNSRALPVDEASQLNTEIAVLLKKNASPESLRIVSRSDSTLRGHFPAETDALTEILGPYDGIVVVPYFREGGRITVNSTHYVLQDRKLVEAARTEFAQDSIFGFKNSFLPAWIREKSQGRWRESDVLNVDLKTIRSGGPEAVAQCLREARDMTPVVLNALCDSDLEVAVLGLCQAEAQGKRFLYRTAASFVKIRAGIEDVPLYRPTEGAGPGLIVVGSHVQRTTEQLEALLQIGNLDPFMVRIAEVLGKDAPALQVRLKERIGAALATKRSVVVYTEREYAVSGSDKERLRDGQRISDFLVDLVAGLDQRPGFIIAKGGITSCDIAVKALDVQQATVLGQILPGIPVWRLGHESRYPGIDYVVFPGNVGDRQGLVTAFKAFAFPSP